MKIISCAGYYDSGSSAVTNLCREYENVCSIGGETEIRFIQDPGGIADLEYNLVENNHRHNTSDAIKRFIRYMDYQNGTWYAKRYKEYFGEDLQVLTDKYIKDIVDLKAKSWWHGERIEWGKVKYFLDILYGRLLRTIFRGKVRGSQTFFARNEFGYYTSITKEDFYRATRNYIDQLFSIYNKEKKEYIVVDQLVPPTNCNRYVNYFNNIHIIIVDRDPRDIFIQSRVEHRYVIPVRDVYEYCQWYKITRCNRHENEPNIVLRLRFEDFIYDYENTVNKVESFTGLKASDHKYKEEYFSIIKSRENTGLFRKHTQFSKEIRVIEEQLGEFLYNF